MSVELKVGQRENLMANLMAEKKAAKTAGKMVMLLVDRSAEQKAG